ncbi:TniQ family protein [Aurantimonas coralicida]|nr:TniQ family protein [Aurantimonas coralicida]
MSQVRRAPLRVRERPGEPASWLMRRLGERNGYHEPREFGVAFGLDFEAQVRGFGTADLSLVSGLPAEGLAEWSPVPVGKNEICLRGQVLRYPFDWDGGFSAPAARACPRCIGSDLRYGSGPRAFRPYVRAWWCLRDVQTCPIHLCALARVHTQQDGAEPLPFWKACEGIDSAPVPASDVEADRYVLGRLGAMPELTHPILDGLPLGEASALLSWLGELANGTEPTDIRSMSPGDAARFRSKGLELAGEWPGRIHARLLELLHGRPQAARGFKGIYGRFYSRLYDDRSNRDSHTGREILKDVFEAHALEAYPFGPNETLFRKQPKQSLRVNMVHAAQICGVERRAMGALIYAFGIRTTADRIRREGIARADVEAVRDARARSVPAARAALRAP